MYLSSGSTSTVLRLTGVDSSRFLQGQLTCDVSRLEDGQWTWAAACSPKGRVIDVFKLFRQQPEDYLLLSWSDDASKRLLTHLAKYKVFFKCEFHSDTGSQCVGILSRADNVRKALDLSPAWQIVDAHSLVLQDVKQGSRRKLAQTIGEDELYWAELIIDGGGQTSDARAVSTLESLRRRFASSHDEDYLWKAAMLGFGIPRLNEAQSESYTVHALGLHSLGAVSFSKGCFTGQEIVARTQYLGSAKKAPVGLAVVDEAIQQRNNRYFADGAALDAFVEEQAGKVLDCCDIPAAPGGSGAERLDDSVKSFLAKYHRICVALLDPEKI